MEKYEVEAFIKGKVTIEAENEDDAIEKAACLNYKDFNWGGFYVNYLEKV